MKAAMSKQNIYVVLRVVENFVAEVYDVFETLHNANIMVESENEKPHIGVIQVVNLNSD